MTTDDTSELPSQTAHVAVDSEVEVRCLASKQAVADGSAHQPGVPVPGRELDEGGQWAALGAHTGVPSRW